MNLFFYTQYVEFVVLEISRLVNWEFGGVSQLERVHLSDLIPRLTALYICTMLNDCFFGVFSQTNLVLKYGSVF